jgi:predicted restriction endonuclease
MPDAFSQSSLAALTWKQGIANRILQHVNEAGTFRFTIDDAYTWIPEFRILFPENRHVREKLRQSLQRLRDDGFLRFDGGGRYRINTGFEEIEVEDVRPLPVGTIQPPTRTYIRTVRLRNTLLAWELKRRYQSLCQVCRQPVWIGERKRYAEAHHLRPLGAPHFGPDIPENLLVLCPNHHVMFDHGAVVISPKTFKIRHCVDGALTWPELYFASWHHLAADYITFHNRIICHALLEPRQA